MYSLVVFRIFPKLHNHQLQLVSSFWIIPLKHPIPIKESLPTSPSPQSLIVVQLRSCVSFFVTPWPAACQTPLSFTISWSLLKLKSIEPVMQSNHLILCRPLLLLLSIFPSIRVFSNESALCIRWPNLIINFNFFVGSNWDWLLLLIKYSFLGPLGLVAYLHDVFISSLTKQGNLPRYCCTSDLHLPGTWLQGEARVLFSLGGHWHLLLCKSALYKLHNGRISLAPEQISLLAKLLQCSPARLLCPRGSPGKNIWVGSHALLQGFFLTQGSNRCLLVSYIGRLVFYP